MDNGNAIQIKEEFQNNTAILCEQTNALVQSVSPYLSIEDTDIRKHLDNDSIQTIQEMRFFKLNSCTTEQVDDLSEHLNEKMDKLFTAIHSLGVAIAYGVISYNGKTNLVLGIGGKEAQDIVGSVIGGLLTGIDLTPFNPDFSSRSEFASDGGIVSAVPVVKIEDEKQKFDISALMRSLNGKNYTVLCIAKPYSLQQVQDKYKQIVSIRDNCFAVSKRNIAQQNSTSNTDTTTTTKSKSFNFGGMAGVMISPVMLGANAGGSFSDSVSNAVAETIGTSDTVSYDVQNGFALEIIEYCDKAIERLKQGQNTGMWGTAIAYSANDTITANIIKSCLCGELSKPVDDFLPSKCFSFKLNKKEQILIPCLDIDNDLFAPITSSELGMICTPPFEAVPDFELK